MAARIATTGADADWQRTATNGTQPAITTLTASSRPKCQAQSATPAAARVAQPQRAARRAAMATPTATGNAPPAYTPQNSSRNGGTQMLARMWRGWGAS